MFTLGFFPQRKLTDPAKRRVFRFRPPTPTSLSSQSTQRATRGPSNLEPCMFFHRLIVAAGLCLIGLGIGLSDAEAAIRTFTWVHPTTNSDGSALPLSQITRTTLVWGTSATTMTSSKVVTGTATTTTLDLAAGTWYVGAKTTANGNDSDISNVVQVVIAQPVPNPPTLSVVPVVAGLNMSPVYKILPDGSRSQIVSGFVPVGTACSGPIVFTYRSKPYRKVPNSIVRWWSPTLADVRSPPPVAVACA